MANPIVTRRAVTLAGVWCKEVAEQAIADWNALHAATQTHGWADISEILRDDADASVRALRSAKPEEYEAERAKAAVSELVTEIGRQAERLALAGLKFIREKQERPRPARTFKDHDDAMAARRKAIAVTEFLATPGGKSWIDDLVAIARVHAIMLPRRKEDLEYHQEHIRAIARFLNKVQELLDFGVCAEDFMREELEAQQRKEQDNGRRQ